MLKTCFPPLSFFHSSFDPTNQPLVTALLSKLPQRKGQKVFFLPFQCRSRILFQLRRSGPISPGDTSFPLLLARSEKYEFHAAAAMSFSSSSGGGHGRRREKTNEFQTAPFSGLQGGRNTISPHPSFPTRTKIPPSKNVRRKKGEEM